MKRKISGLIHQILLIQGASPMVISNLRDIFFKKNPEIENAYKRVMLKEAIIGGGLFGTVPKGCRREFFCLDENTWVWHEEWMDAEGNLHTVVTRYDVRADGVYRAQDYQPYQAISDTEAERLYIAIDRYNQAVDSAFTIQA